MCFVILNVFYNSKCVLHSWATVDRSLKEVKMNQGDINSAREALLQVGDRLRIIQRGSQSEGKSIVYIVYMFSIPLLNIYSIMHLMNIKVVENFCNRVIVSLNRE